MKYAIISDIHGNMPALQKILEDADAQGVQGFFLVGDYCISAPWAAEVVDAIRVLDNTWIIKGNEENYMNVPNGTNGQFEISRYGKSRLSEEQKKWLSGLPGKLDFQLENMEIHMIHNLEDTTGKLGCWPVLTWQTAVHYGKEDVPHEQLLEDIRTELSGNENFRNALEILPSGIYIFGHNHLQWHMQTENHLFINPGSCGIPLDCGEFGVPYTILNMENGRATVEERRLPLDAEEMIGLVKATSQYREARVWSELICGEWRSVREKTMFFLKFAEKFAQSIGDERRPFEKDTWEAAFEAWKCQVD